MSQEKRIAPYSLRPGEKLPDDFKLALKKINSEYGKTRNIVKYRENLRKLFILPETPPMSEDQKQHVAGFIEGEGSISVSAKKSQSSRFGVYFDPEFSVTQHVNGSVHLYEIFCYFRTGLITYKNGSNATLVFRIDNRQTLKEKVVPFLKEYVFPRSSDTKKIRFQRWCQLLDLYDQKAHQDQQKFMYEIAPLWDELRMQKGQSNQSFKNLEEFQQYVIDHVRAKAQKMKIHYKI